MLSALNFKERECRMDSPFSSKGCCWPGRADKRTGMLRTDLRPWIILDLAQRGGTNQCWLPCDTPPPSFHVRNGQYRPHSIKLPLPNGNAALEARMRSARAGWGSPSLTEIG